MIQRAHLINKKNLATSNRIPLILTYNRTLPFHYNFKLNNLCCTQVQSTDFFRNIVTRKTFKIYNKLSCKSKYLIYLMECVLCKEQYTGKSETTFTLRLNNHQKDVNKQNSLRANQHVRLTGHNFNKHAKFTLIEQLNEINIDKELLK